MTAHLLTRVGTERFALALGCVIEALDAPALHDPPRRPDGMLGTLRHRGQTLPVWDGARAFGIPRDAGAGTVLVLDDGGRHLAMVVDDALDVMDIVPASVRAAPVGSDGGGLLACIVRDADGLVGVVRVDALVSRLQAWGARRTE
jgi:chemotaxis signal transduction protein